MDRRKAFILELRRQGLRVRVPSPGDIDRRAILVMGAGEVQAHARLELAVAYAPGDLKLQAEMIAEVLAHHGIQHC